MLYVRREEFDNNLVADADGLMREFYSAEQHGRELDQNNMKAAGVGSSYVVPSSELSGTGLTVGHFQGGGKLESTLTGLTLTVDPTAWSTAATYLEFTTVGPLEVQLFARGQYHNGAGGIIAPSIFDARFLIDGQAGEAVFSRAFNAGGGADVRFGWSLMETVLLFSGDHKIGLQGRDRSGGSATSAGTIYDYSTGTSGQAVVFAVGFRP